MPILRRKKPSVRSILKQMAKDRVASAKRAWYKGEISLDQYRAAKEEARAIKSFAKRVTPGLLRGFGRRKYAFTVSRDVLKNIVGEELVKFLPERVKLYYGPLARGSLLEERVLGTPIGAIKRGDILAERMKRALGIISEEVKPKEGFNIQTGNIPEGGEDMPLIRRSNVIERAKKLRERHANLLKKAEDLGLKDHVERLKSLPGEHNLDKIFQKLEKGTYRGLIGKRRLDRFEEELKKIEGEIRKAEMGRGPPSPGRPYGGPPKPELKKEEKEELREWIKREQERMKRNQEAFKSYLEKEKAREAKKKEEEKREKEIQNKLKDAKSFLAKLEEMEKFMDAIESGKGRLRNKNFRFTLLNPLKRNLDRMYELREKGELTEEEVNKILEWKKKYENLRKVTVFNEGRELGRAIRGLGEVMKVPEIEERRITLDKEYVSDLAEIVRSVLEDKAGEHLTAREMGKEDFSIHMSNLSREIATKLNSALLGMGIKDVHPDEVRDYVKKWVRFEKGNKRFVWDDNTTANVRNHFESSFERWNLPKKKEVKKK